MNFHENPPVEAVWTNRQTDRYDESNSRFGNFANARSKPGV